MLRLIPPQLAFPIAVAIVAAIHFLMPSQVNPRQIGVVVGQAGCPDGKVQARLTTWPQSLSKADLRPVPACLPSLIGSQFELGQVVYLELVGGDLTVVDSDRPHVEAQAKVEGHGQ